MNNKSDLKGEISKLTGGTLNLANEGLDVAKEGIELWASVKTLNIIGVVKNGYEFLNESSELISKVINSFEKAGPILDNIKSDIVDSQDLKDINKELSDVQKEWSELKETFEKKGIFAALPELLDLFKEIGESLSSATKGIGDLISEVSSGIADGVSGAKVDQDIKEQAEEVSKLVEKGKEIAENGLERVEEAKKYIENKVSEFQSATKGISSGVTKVDIAKGDASKVNVKGSDKSIG